jgi:ElaB/YqjD/DUF883 family membrane-anchored ribosome-binding protein
MSREPSNDPLTGGEEANPGREPEAGSAYVETHISGPREPGAEESFASRAVHRTRSTIDEARDRTGEWTERASEFASRARHELDEAFDRAEQRLEDQTGVVGLVREYPLAAAGLAFGIGFLLAADSGARRRRGVMGRATGQLRSALVGGATTMLMQELQDLLDEHGGPAGLLAALTGREA